MYELLMAYAPDGPEAIDRIYVNEFGVNPDVEQIVADLADDQPYVDGLRDWVRSPHIWTAKRYEWLAEALLHHIDIDDRDYKAYQDRYFQNDNRPAFDL
jgi:hypothetical protein